ncbi:hypothetical protein FACS1894170_01810 [Planctomycetales bacterium]|nr:hypothetical protein FACS1894170_01810 [Planctomycetales bacterium]
MKRLLLLAAFLLTIAAVSATAFAQPPGGPGGPDGQRGPRGQRGPGGFGNFFDNAKFKEELKLSDEQVANLKKVAEELRPPRQPRGGGNTDAPPPMPSREEFEKRIDEQQARFNQILTPEQQAKFVTLQFQVSGGLDSPFLGARSLGVLKLTDEQKAKVKAIEDQRSEKARAAFQGFRDLSPEDRTKRFQELEASGKEFAAQLKAVLTPEQLAQGEKLTAEAKAVRENLGLPEPGQRGFGGDRGNRQRGGERERPQGGDGYRPGAGSWQPGQGVQGQPQENDAPKRQFPRSEN